ncbi:MAG TPA: sugar-transfer associated ATP-grasp domain-containing protein [Verrucomicrobiales bacterium]|nr:sugar-transfer associated ATP-grasp domain-containing protein [Verrucomicrobiales bacterium]
MRASKNHPPLFQGWISFASNAGAAGPIHRACNRFLRSQHRGAGRLKLAGRRLIWPWRAFQAARACYSVYGQGCRRDFGLSPLRQWIQMTRLALLYSVPPESYYVLRLHEGRGHPAEYLHDFETYPLLSALPRDRAWFDAQNSKSCFAQFCLDHHLLSIPTLGVLQDHVWSPTSDATFPPSCSFVAKPDRGAQGWGVEIFDLLAEGGGYRGFDGGAFSPAELAHHLNERSTRSALILQPRIAMHPALAPLSSGALPTLRVITLREPDGTLSAWFPRLNLPVGRHASDNMRSGGGAIASAVDLNSARLGPATGKEALGGIHDLHPDTGVTITGFPVPCFHDAMALARRAQAAMTGLPSIGWDIAITPDGPLLVEANSGWGVMTIQRVLGRPLAREQEFCRRLTAILEQHLNSK